MALNEQPYIHNKAIIAITAPALDLSCMARTLVLAPTDEEVDIETQCAQGATAPGRTTWDFSADFLQSFDSADAAGDGLWNQLHALAKTLVEIKVKPKDAAVDSTNPEATFQMYFPSIPFINVTTIGDKTIVPVAGKAYGAPTFATS